MWYNQQNSHNSDMGNSTTWWTGERGGAQIIFLDIDGVMSPLPHQQPSSTDGAGKHPSGYDDTADTPGHFNTPTSPQLWTDLWNIGTKIVWVSSWGRLASELASSVDAWPAGAVESVERRNAEQKPGWWKLNTVLEWCTTHNVTKIVWCDDDLGDHLHSIRKSFKARNIDALLVCPDRYIGLTREDVEQIRSAVKNSGLT